MKVETSSLAHDNQMPGGALSNTRSAMPSPAFFRLRDVLRITSLSRPTLYRRIAAHRFPAPVHLGGRACGWASAALQSWINDPAGYGAPSGGDDPTCRKRGRPRKSG
jgi:prophage regulatory protein